MRNDNLKKTGQLQNVWVELGFGTVCFTTIISMLKSNALKMIVFADITEMRPFQRRSLCL